MSKTYQYKGVYFEKSCRRWLACLRLPSGNPQVVTRD